MDPEAKPRSVSLARADGPARHSFARNKEVVPIPNLNNVQRDSFEWFLREGLKELFAEISPIQESRSVVRPASPRVTEV
jgi:DNA-directed RNA polymerase beta subunit